MARLLSLNVGLPKDVPWQGRTVRTGIWKEPVDGPRLVRRLNIDGDGQGDLQGHGGEQRAVFVYQADSYRYWERHLGRRDLTYGQFGENFTVDGLADDEVCIGDRYRIGEAEFEVTQPRVTCFRVGMRLGEPEMPALLVSHHRPGFYLRVITEGRVRAGDEIVRSRSGPHHLTIADVDALLYLPGRDVARLRAALDVPALSPGWQGSFRELLDAAAAPAPVAVASPAWTGFRPLRVARVVAETGSVRSVYLVADDGQPLPTPLAGQYLTFRVADLGDPRPVRSYSLSSGPGDAAYRISVKQEPHGLVSGWVHAGLQPGAVLEAAAPRGDFVLDTAAAGPVLLVSAGVGATPALAMLHALAAARSEREVWWLHVARNRAAHVFRDEAHRLLASLPHAHERVFYTAADADPGDAVMIGRPTAEALAGLGLPVDATAYVCGPPAFMTAIGDALAGLGIARDRIRTELFGALPAINPGVVGADRPPPHQPPGPAGTGPAVTFARSGLTVRWAAGWASLLDLADACDVPTRFACRSGVCHTCVTPVAAGEVAYRPAPLEPPAAGSVLICCAQPRDDLVLDL